MDRSHHEGENKQKENGTDRHSTKLLKIKTAMSATAKDYVISLPRGKSQARYENVTINYNFDAFDEIERPMECPSTPERMDCDQDLSGGRGYTLISSPKDRTPPQQVVEDRLIFDGPNQLQLADAADITLQEDISSGPSSNHEHFADFGMGIDEQIPPSDPMDMAEQYFPEIHFADEIQQAPLSNEEKTNDVLGNQEQLEPDDQVVHRSSVQREEPMGPESPDHHDEGAAAPTKQKRKRKTRGKSMKSVVDSQPEIPASVFESWLRDSTDIGGRRNQPRKRRQKLAASSISRSQRLFHLPSSCFSLRSSKPKAVQLASIPELESEWASQLTDLWNRNIDCENLVPRAQSNGPGGPSNVNLDRNPHDPSSLSDTALPNVNQGSSNNSHSDPSLPGAEIHSGSSTESTRIPHEQDVGEQPQYNVTSVEQLRSVLDINLVENGSVEKLRTALQSPRTGPRPIESPVWDNQLPTSAQITTRERQTKRPSTPASAKLTFDKGGEHSGSGSGRVKRARLSSPAIQFDDNSGTDFFTGYDIPAPEDLTGSADYLANLKSTLKGSSLSQFELLEDTAGPSTQGTDNQHNAMNNVSLTVLQCLRQNFSYLGEQCKDYESLDALSEGLNKSQAAKLFYQVLVLTSNSYLELKQDGPGADIIITRGQNM